MFRAVGADESGDGLMRGTPQVFFRPLRGFGFAERLDQGFHPWLLTVAAPQQVTER